MTNDILLSLDKGKSVLLVTLDVSAAFDTFNHSMLLERYRTDFGMEGLALKWMASYLEGRMQSVQIGTSKSEPYLSESGFPQGSVLGRPKFSMHTTPLDALVRSHEVEDQCYADDSNLYVTLDLKDPIQTQDQLLRIEDCLSDVSNWMLRNRLKVNASKTTSILFTPTSRTLSVPPTADIVFDGSIITTSNVLKSLGVLLDPTMTMTKQVNSVVSSAWIQLRNISKTRNQLSRKVAETLVNTLVTSKLDYCNSLLCCLPAKLLNKLQKVQNASAKTVLLARKRSHVTPLLKQLHWLPVELLCKYKILLLAYKVLNNSAPSYLKDLVSYHVPPRNLRSSNEKYLTRKYGKTKYGSRAFSCLAPSLWNSLPLSIRQAETLLDFKTKLKTHFFIEHFGP